MYHVIIEGESTKKRRRIFHTLTTISNKATIASSSLTHSTTGTIWGYSVSLWRLNFFVISSLFLARIFLVLRDSPLRRMFLGYQFVSLFTRFGLIKNFHSFRIHSYTNLIKNIATLKYEKEGLKRNFSTAAARRRQRSFISVQSNANNEIPIRSA